MRSTIGQLVEFKSSNIWRDIEEELKTWLGMVHEQLENADMSADHMELDRLGGSAQAIRNFSDILEVLVSLAEDNKDAHDALLNNLIKGR